MAWFLGWMMDEGECGLVVECVTDDFAGGDDGDEFDESGYKNEHGVFPWWVVSFGEGIFIQYLPGQFSHRTMGSGANAVQQPHDGGRGWLVEDGWKWKGWFARKAVNNGLKHGNFLQW